MSQQLLEDALSRDGVVVTRAACPEAASAACAACLAASLDGLKRKLALPQTMAERMRGPSLRQFVPVCTESAAVEEPFAAALRAALAGEAGAILVETLGRDAELRELQVIVSEPGAAAQEVHSDSNYDADAPRLVTAFVALHDLLDECMGPTHFWPHTHAPHCFPPSCRWLPPTAPLAAERRSVWYALLAGDAVLMDACTWHRGGANTSGTRRSLLAASFVASDRATAAGEGVPRLGDFV
jgi:ectoine hydroxylase-related dioxygenase (phytanoyl-CoA dioxygenase family)